MTVLGWIRRKGGRKGGGGGVFKIVRWRRGPVKGFFSRKYGGMLKGCKNQFHNANQHVSYCLVDVIRRVGACSVDASVGWFGNIVRYGAPIGELRSAKGESK